MKLSVKIINGFQQLTVFAKSFILDVWLGSEFTSASDDYSLEFINCESVTRKITTVLDIHAFYKQHFFSAQPQCCLTFSWIELQMLLRCCLVHIAVIMLRHILYLVYLSPCPDLGLFTSMWSIFHFQSYFHCHYCCKLI